VNHYDVEALSQHFEDKKYVVSGFPLTPDVCIGRPNGVGAWGFWLPSQLKTDSLDDVTAAFDTGRRRFNAIEKAFRDWFELSQDELLLEEGQAGYFEEHPERDLSYRFIGPV
jgi:hypothetical protein